VTYEHLYTTSLAEVKATILAGWSFEGIGWQAPSSGVPVYRMYNPSIKQHLYTSDLNEYKVNASRGWSQEGAVFYSSGTKQIGRQYNPDLKVHLYDILPNNEWNVLPTRGWVHDGSAAYLSAVADGNPNYTTSDITSWQKTYTAQQAALAAAQVGKKAPTYFSQLNPQWSGVRLNGSTVGPSGCVPTSLAMILRGTFGMAVDPGTVARKMDPISSYSFGASGSDYLRTAQAYGRTAHEVSTKAEAISLLQQGYPLTIYINVGIGHSVVLYGYTNGTTEVYDPYGQKFYALGVQYSLDSLWNKTSQDSIDWDAGRPVFVITN
jgi:uncharacterized protein YvpB